MNARTITLRLSKEESNFLDNLHKRYPDEKTSSKLITKMIRASSNPQAVIKRKPTAKFLYECLVEIRDELVGDE